MFSKVECMTSCGALSCSSFPPFVGSSPARTSFSRSSLDLREYHTGLNVEHLNAIVEYKNGSSRKESRKTKGDTTRKHG